MPQAQKPILTDWEVTLHGNFELDPIERFHYADVKIAFDSLVQEIEDIVKEAAWDWWGYEELFSHSDDVPLPDPEIQVRIYELDKQSLSLPPYQGPEGWRWTSESWYWNFVVRGKISATFTLPLKTRGLPAYGKILTAPQALRIGKEILVAEFNRASCTKFTVVWR